MLTVSKILSSVSHDIPVFKIKYENFEDHIRWMAWQEGKLYAIHGSMGTGKTDFSLRIAEDMWHANNTIMFISNITVKHERFKYTVTASDLLLFLATYQHPFIILDDSSIFYSSTEAVSQRTRNMNTLIAIIRKFRANMLFIAHVRKYIPRFVKEYGEWIIKKRNKTVAEMDPYIIEDIPATTLQYNTYEIGTFMFDIDIDAVLKEISGIADEKDMRKALIKYIEEWKKEKAEENIKQDYRYWLAKSAIMLKNSMGLPYSQYANLLGIKRETLRNWIHKFYKDGG